LLLVVPFCFVYYYHLFRLFAATFLSFNAGFGDSRERDGRESPSPPFRLDFSTTKNAFAWLDSAMHRTGWEISVCARPSERRKRVRWEHRTVGRVEESFCSFFFTASFSLVGWFRACHACAFFCYSFSSSRDASGSVRREEDDDDDWSSRTNTANSRRVTESWAAASASPDFSARHWRISFLFSSFPFPSFIFRSLSLK